MADDTLLVITGLGLPSYSARGLTQTLQPITLQGVEAHHQRRAA